jgi:hypothetical protein
MGWTQRQARPAEPPTSRSEALASCTSHRGIGSIAASPLTALAGRRGLILVRGTAWRAPSDYNINHLPVATPIMQRPPFPSVLRRCAPIRAL